MTDTTTAATPSFARGAAAADKKIKANKPKYAKRANFFGIKDGEVIVVRFIDDEPDWFSTKQHSFIPTRGPAPDATDDQKSNYPKQFGAVCRHDDAFEGIYDECYICDHMTKEDGKSFWPAVRMWARVAVREEVRGTQEHVDQKLIPKEKIGTIIGYTDAEDEEDETKDGKPTGKKIKRKRILVINQPKSTFFAGLEAYADPDVYGTVLDRDFRIKRKGSGKGDTEYMIAALDQINEKGTGRVFDLRNPELDAEGNETGRTVRDRYLDDAPDLVALLEDNASDRHYDWFFDQRHPHPKRGGGDDSEGDAPASGGQSTPPAGAPAEQQTKPADDPVLQEKLDEMRARVTSEHGRPAATENGAASPAAEPAPAAEEEKEPASGGLAL